MALTVKAAEAKKEPGMYSDGAGLYLRVGPTGSKSWILRTVIQGKRGEMGLGSFDLVGLAEARELAAGYRKVAREGRDPIEERKAARKAAAEAQALERMTFEQATRDLHSKLLPTWKNKKHGEVWLASIENDVLPTLGKRPIASLDREDVAKVLEPIWQAKPETAKRVRQRVAAIFDWAIGEGFYQSANPVHQLKHRLGKVSVNVQHLASMPWRQLPAFISELSERDAISARCLEFLILTAARSGEARGVTWDEIDLAGKTWNVPAERMKRGKPHRVPLSEPALAVLEKVRGLDPVMIFPSPQRRKGAGARPMSDMAFKLLYGRMNVDGITTHGFRSTFRDWCSESAKADPELAEAALSHATGSAVTRAYARSDLIDRRRALMDSWAAYATGGTGDVVELVRA